MSQESQSTCMHGVMPGESRSILSNRETGVSIRIIEWNLVLLIMGPGLVVHSLI